jgi:hypothetical protein
VRWPPDVVVVAYVCAVVACGVVLVDDAHFVVRYRQAAAPGARIRASYGCFDSTVLAWRERVGHVIAEIPGGIVDESPLVRDAHTEPYADADAKGARWLAWAGATLFALACAAPLAGLWALGSTRAGQTLRQAVVLLVSLAPLATLEGIGLAVEARESADPLLADVMWSLHPTAYTWWARFAWTFLALAGIISWGRRRRRAAVMPVDPATFD